MEEKLTVYISKLSSDENIEFNDKKQNVQFALLNCEKIIMDIYCFERDSCFIKDKLIVKNGQLKGLHLNSSCNIAYQALFSLLDVMEKFLDSEYEINSIWNKICIDIKIILNMRSQATVGTDGKKYYCTPRGAEIVYGDAKKLKEYALKGNSNFELNDTLIPSSEGGKGIELAQGCYIATCVYGSYDCPQVWTLRRFRDNTLDEVWYGKVFIKCYYAISPKLVKWFGKTKWFTNFWKSRLDKMVAKLNSRGVWDTKYDDKY